MIPLRLRMEEAAFEETVVVRLRERPEHGQAGPHDALLSSKSCRGREYDYRGFGFRVVADENVDMDGDVVLLQPRAKAVHRLIRAGSPHNTLVVTERCDQVCLMCSQPPKARHADMFDYFRTAIALAPQNATIGLSGGEPTLYVDELLDLLRDTMAERPDIRFHVLTNAQHFSPRHIARLGALPNRRLLWGVPLYSHKAQEHDAIVGKAGAYDLLMDGLDILLRSGSAVELRTVVMSKNISSLPLLGDMVAKRLPFVAVWALMQMEDIGFARMRWDELFYDHSHDFGPIATAMDLVRARGLEVALYNFPLCTVPDAYRSHAANSISDWKQKYLDDCSGCSVRGECGGFFQWHRNNVGYARMGAI